MYNNQKPNKFAVEFFLLCDSDHYFIAHVDVYQGKEPHETYIDDRAKGLPTTIKAVMNAIFKRGLDTEPSGRRYLSCDNWHACPQLAVILNKFKIDLGGTCRPGRKGYSASLMTLKKNNARGSYKMAYDKHNRVLCSQWVDSKVVHAVTTLLCSSNGVVKRQKGSVTIELNCPQNIIEYQKSMYGWC